MKKINIALLRGGASSEREVSLESGRHVYQALDKSKYNIVEYDPKIDIEKLVKDASDIDLALIILHGPFGEDGTVQGLLDLLNIPYQGSGILGSAIAMNKVASKHIYERFDIPVTPYVLISHGDDYDVDELVDLLGLPIVVKPVLGGSSLGMTIVKLKESLKEAIELGFQYDSSLLLEKYIKGIELTCSVIGNESLIAFPVVEIIPSKNHEFFDYKAKYTKGETEEVCPARIDKGIYDKIQKFAKKAHKHLFCRGYSRTDFILSDGSREIFVLETNTIPGMTPTSLLPLSAKEYGFSFTELLDKLIELGLENKK